MITTAATLHAHGIDQPRHGGPGRGSAAARSPAITHLCAVCRRHHRHRSAGGAGARRFGGLCGGRKPSACAAVWNCFGEPARSRFLRHRRRGDPWAAPRSPSPAFSPIAMLFWSAVINGVVAVPIMACDDDRRHRRKAARAFALPALAKGSGSWLAAGVMGLAVVLLAWLSMAANKLGGPEQRPELQTFHQPFLRREAIRN